MALCVAHATAGYLAYEALRPAGRHRPGLLATAVVLANAPDLDFLPGILVGAPTLYHRGVTHTLGAALAVAVGAWLLARAGWLRGATPGFWCGFAGAAWATHLVVDWITVDVVPPFGARFLWPFVHQHLHAPVTVLGEIVVDPRSRLGFVASILAPAALLAWGREVLLAITVVVGVQTARALREGLAPAGFERPESLEQADP